MTNDELEDRVKGLESLVLRLIQHLELVGSLPADTREQMVDSLIDVATGDRRAEFHARRLQEAIEGSGSSTMEDVGARTRARQQALRDLYGSED